MTARTRYFVISSLLVLFVGLGSGLVAYYVGFPAGAFSSGGPDELRYIPRDVAVVAYADVRQVMASELRQRLRQVAPGQENGQRELEQRTGINVETDIDHVVASLQADPTGNMPSAGIVLARGTFNEVKIEALMREHGAQVLAYKDKRIIVAPTPTPPPADPNSPSPETLSTPPEFALSFLKPGLVALGSSNLIRRAIDLENGGDNVTTNEEVMNLVRSLDSGNAWAVGRFDALRTTGRLPDAAVNQLPPISWFSVVGQVSDGIDGVLRAETTSDEAAKNLRDVVQGFIALARLQAGSKPEMQAFMQSLQISGSGKTVALSFSVPGSVIDLIGAAGNQPRNRQLAH